jgi:hypothetical protein
MCQAKLADYVRLELEGREVEKLYPGVAFHIESCETCESLYYREFRTQGQQKSVAELKELGDRSQVEDVMNRLLSSSQSPPVSLKSKRSK